MRKTILMLINGFGIERSGSAEIYSSKLMPNLDKMTKENLFGTLAVTAGDYNNAYQLFSIPPKTKSEEDEIDNLIYEKKLGENGTFQKMLETLTTENKLHIFYTIEDTFKWPQVREFLKIINVNKDKKIFVHIILKGTSIQLYDEIIKIISKLSFEMGQYCKIGFVVGANKINSDDVLRCFYKEHGEHWNESTKKFEILKNEIISPEEAGVFAISNGFSLVEGDTVLFLNYSDINIEKFYNDFTKMPRLNIFSLYKLNDTILNMFVKKDEVTSSLSAILENYGIKLLVMTEENRINDINFYLNGRKRQKSENITYALNNHGLLSQKENVINFIETTPYDGYILDFHIGLLNKGDDIRNTLSQIDSLISSISAASKEKDYTFIISSLYGMHAPIIDGVLQKVVDFSGKVPCIFQSNMFPKNDYSLNSGNTYSLCLTFLTNINDEVKANKLVHKMNKLEKVLSKK